MHRSSLALVAPALALALLVPGSAVAKSPGKPPPKPVIQRLLTQTYVGDDPQMYPGTRYSLKVVSVKRGAPRKGSYRHDGVPPGKTTFVFPTKVTSIYVVCYTDGTARRDKIVDKDVFFKDEFGEWTYRLQDQQRTDGTSDKLASCPL